MAELSPLRRRMVEDMTIRNLSPATQRSYISAVSKLSRHFGRSPDRLDVEDIRAFQVHLAGTGISWPGLNQIVCALRFFYGVTLGRTDIPELIPYAREPHKLPVVLSADEVVRFLQAVSGLKSRAALATAYAAGLRAAEVASLRVADIDSARGVIHVRHGKGGKDREAMLSPQLLAVLRTYWRLARPKTFLFPGRDPDRPIHPAALHTACRAAVEEAGLAKRVGQVIQIDEARIRAHLGEMVRVTIEEALNAMLDAEADRLYGAARYERSDARQHTRTWHYEHSRDTKAGPVSLRIPKLRRQTFETAIIERFQRRESSVEEALIETYIAGVSVRWVEDITEALWGTQVSSSAISNLNKKIYAKIEEWRNRRIGPTINPKITSVKAYSNRSMFALGRLKCHRLLRSTSLTTRR